LLIPDTDEGLALVSLPESLAAKYGIEAADPEPIATKALETQ